MVEKAGIRSGASSFAVSSGSRQWGGVEDQTVTSKAALHEPLMPTRHCDPKVPQPSKLRCRKISSTRLRDEQTWSLPEGLGIVTVRGPDFAQPMRANHVMLPEDLRIGTVRGPDRA